MKITAIKTANFLGARNVDVKITKPICLFAGKNFSGKSSLQEAVRMALTGESVRVRLKKDYRNLVTDGAEVGFCVVEHDGGQSAITLPNGAHEHTGNRQPAILPFVLDAQRFSGLPPDERRQFLFGLMGMRADSETVGARLLDKGCDPLKTDHIRPFLRAGFDSAHKEAQAKSRDAKAAWRATTGETYGSVKAATWTAPRPAHDSGKLSAARSELSAVTAMIEGAAADIAVMQSASERQAKQSAKIAELRDTAKRYAAIEAKLTKDQAELAEWQTKVAQEENKGVGKRMPVEPAYSCPKCAAKLRHDHTNGALVEFTPPPIVTDPSDPGRLAECQRARDLLARSVENDKRDRAAADIAARTLAEIEDAQSDPAPAPEEIDAKKSKLAELRNESVRVAGVVKSLEDNERLASRADEKTVDASRHRADVAQWEVIADALSPSGIPGDMLSEALGPINDRLARSSNESQWLRVGIDADMSIVADGVRPYELLSESERWRADAMIAEAISHLSGVNLLVLDRVDVLDLAGREDLLYWLDELATAGQMDTALLFATLKALPSSLPPNVGAVWIENGVTGRPE